MRVRAVRIAYALPPLLAVVLGFVGLLRIDLDGVVGVSSVVTTVSGAHARSNAHVAEDLEGVARARHATIVRVVADRRSPDTRRTVLVTGAPETIGADWLRAGYPALAPSVSTRVIPMSALDRYDTAGAFGVVGDDRTTRAVAAALRRDGYSTTTERIPELARAGIAGGLAGSGGLVTAVVLGVAAMCLMGTVGAPRRFAVARLGGRSPAAILREELSETRYGVAALGVGGGLALVATSATGGSTTVPLLGSAITTLAVVLLLPVVAVHALGVLWASRMRVGSVLRGARPPRSLLGVTVLGRVVALLLVVVAAFDLAASTAAMGAGGTDRDLRAAGGAVQLWVTPESRPGAQTQAYWDGLGRFAAAALSRREAILSAAADISVGAGPRTTPALFVDRSYLRRHDVRDDTGERITGDDDRVGVWLPSTPGFERRAVVDPLRAWELRDAPPEQLRTIGGGRLGDGALYSYPGDASMPTWLDAAVLVVVPEPASSFSADQLGSWLSTGDVVFESARLADRAIARSGLAAEFSAVVDVGQDAAERARRAVTDVRLDATTLGVSTTVLLVAGFLAVSTHRRRYGRTLFVRFGAGASWLRADAAMIAVEAGFLVLAIVSVALMWADPGTGGDPGSLQVDPGAWSAADGAIRALSAVWVVTVATALWVVRTARSAVRRRGAEE